MMMLVTLPQNDLINYEMKRIWKNAVKAILGFAWRKPQKLLLDDPVPQLRFESVTS
jgi:hypothetical protein